MLAPWLQDESDRNNPTITDSDSWPERHVILPLSSLLACRVHCPEVVAW